MALSAAEIGEKVFMAQAALAAEQSAAAHTGEPRSEDELVVALVTGLLHWAVANGYDGDAIATAALKQFDEDRRGPVDDWAAKALRAPGGPGKNPRTSDDRFPL
jgi:hypothetical protein